MSKSKKRSTDTENLSGDDLILPRAEKINVDHLIAQSLLRYKNETEHDKRAKHQEVRHLSSMAEEYLSCFALVGYSLQNEEVVIMSIPTPKDEAALADLLRSTFIDFMNSRP
jgi:tRNA isopentenyl-2-thiomethyl-A-37 hydroxylase MiaE